MPQRINGFNDHDTARIARTVRQVERAYPQSLAGDQSVRRGSCVSQLVRLKNPAGSAGSQSALCNYTYDVYGIDNSTVIKTGVTVIAGGSGCRTFPMKVTTPATYGIVFYDPTASSGNKMKILWCNETTGNTTC